MLAPQLQQKRIDADKAIQAGDFQKALDLSDEILRQSPQDSVAYYIRGSARVEIGAGNHDQKMVRDGIADAREAIRYDTKRTAMFYLPYLHGMKNLAALENHPEHAETAVTIATQILGVPGLSNDDRANLLYQRAQSEAYLSRSDPAVADLEEALRAVPAHFGARAALAETLSAAGKTEQATAAFNKLVESFPDSPLSYNNRGMFLQRQGKYDDALADFTKAIERDPKYYYSYTNRGFTLLEMDNPTAAEADFTQSLTLNPQQPLLYFLRGHAKLGRGDASGAIQDQRAAVNLSPNDPAGRGELGFVLFISGDFGGAIQEFDAVQTINPGLRQYTPWKIVALERLGTVNGLKDQFHESLSKNSKQRDWIDHLIAYVLGGETDPELLKAAAEATGTLKSSEICEANYFIGLMKSAAGKPTEATDAYQHAVATKARDLAAYRAAAFEIKKLNPATATTPVGAVVPSSATVPATPAAKK
jgi:tetratricopeptide (TPR) repeat protein